MSPSDQHLEAYATSRIGQVLRGKYTLNRVIGLGGMAVVYGATHRNQAEFAVKMLHPEISINADVRARFVREGYAANSVKHPGVVLVVDDDVTDDGAAFLVMELLDGVPCDALTERAGGTLPLPVAVAIVHQLLDVLSAAHAKGIVHRDLKPANLFLTRERVKVLDFGIARLCDVAAATATQSGVMLGTAAFMPPEQAMASSNEIDATTDLWATGATLFTLLSGTFVHEGENPMQLMIRAATQPARSLRSVAAGVPAPIVAVVDRALAFAKRDRWPDAVAMRVALENACVQAWGEPPSAVLLANYVTATLGGSSGGTPPRTGVEVGGAPSGGSVPGLPYDRTLAVGQSPSGREIAAAAVSSPLAAATTMAGVGTQAITAPVPRRRRSRAGWALGAIGVTLALAGLTTAYYRRPRPDLVAGRAVPSVSVQPPRVAEEPPPLPEGRGAQAPAPAPLVASVSVVAPPDAKVEIDGAPAQLRDGRVELRGALGSVHPVRVLAGGREARAEVVIAESGPVPSRIELAAARAPAPPRPPAGSPAATTRAQPAPSAPKPPSAVPTIDPNF